MPETKFKSSVLIKAPVEEVFAFCASRQGFEQHFPHKIDWQDGPEIWHEGCELKFRFNYLRCWLNYKTRITRWEENRFFVDEMCAGPYKRFVHTHLFEKVEDGTLYTDCVEFSTGFGQWIDRLIGLRQIKATFDKRHARMREILENPAASESHVMDKA